MAEPNGKTYITQAAGVSIVLIWLAALVGIEMPASIAVTLSSGVMLLLRKLKKKGWI